MPTINRKIIHAIFGVMDSLTGLGLFSLPALTLHLMGIDGLPPSELSYLRFIGCFVGAVGASYFLPFRWGADTWTTHWFLTGWIRGLVGSGLLVLILVGAFSWAWIPVVITDLVVAGIQLYWIRTS